jgi:CDGSH-type Zn-finger protein
MATKITVKNNGALRVEGDFEIYDQEGNLFDMAGRTAISLCRCGYSKKQPFCDGEHKKHEFKSEVTACALPPIAPAS